MSGLFLYALNGTRLSAFGTVCRTFFRRVTMHSAFSHIPGELIMDNSDAPLGHAAVSPDSEVIAGSYGTWRLAYTVGTVGVASGGRIRIDTDSDTDWGIPQMDHSAAPEYMTLETPQGAYVGILVQNVTSLALVVTGRPLAQGEKIVLTYGDRSGGSPGSRSQTFAEDRRYFRVSLDTNGDGNFITLEHSPFVPVVGGDIAKLVLTAPSTVVVGQSFRILARAEDEWGNPASTYNGSVKVVSDALGMSEREIKFSITDRGVQWIEDCIITEAGVHKLEATDVARGLRARSNPILCTKESAEFQLYWGDPHGGQVALNTKIPDFFRFARDVAAIDFVGYQRNDHSISTEDWEVQQKAEREFYEPGRFVPLPGFEWSGRTSAGGHHNVYFRRHNQPVRRSGRSGIPETEDEESDLTHVADLHREYLYEDLVITPHVGGEHGDLSYHEPTLEPALEMTSTHGSFQWFLEEAIQRRYKLGFVGGSNSHNGRPGIDRPGHQLRRYAKAGLATVYAGDKTLEGIIDGLKARRCYATTGERILVQVEADGHGIGKEYTISSHPTISAFVAGTAPLESVELYRGLEMVYSHPIEVEESRNRVRILWDGTSRTTSYSGVIWEGRAKVKGASVMSIEKIRFDSPRSRVFDVVEAGFQWYSVTCGYRSGLILTLDGDEDAEIEIIVNKSVLTGPTYGEHDQSGPRKISYAPSEKLSFSSTLGDLKSGPNRVNIGVLNRRITLSLAPHLDGPEEAEFKFTDSSPKPGINPYWLRVIQTDMEMAWVSPIFVDYIAPVV